MLPTIDLKWEREVNNRKVILNFLFSHSEWNFRYRTGCVPKKGDLRSSENLSEIQQKADNWQTQGTVMLHNLDVARIFWL